MSKRSTIAMLPPQVRDELIRRLRESCFSDYAGHGKWLAEQGYVLSKTAIHRFGQATEGSELYELRLRCAEVAAHYSTSETIIANATDLMRWINPPRN